MYLRLYRRKVTALALMLALSCVAATQSGCGPGDVSKVKKKVADAAAILNTAAESNRTLYQSGVYGVAGSPDAIAKRQQVARAVHQANEYLSLAVERAATLTADNLPTGKTDIVALLKKAAQVLGTVNVDNENIRLVLQSAITAINVAVNLTLAIKGT